MMIMASMLLTWLGWVGLGPLATGLGWVGLDQRKWTHVHVWVVLAECAGNSLENHRETQTNLWLVLKFRVMVIPKRLIFSDPQSD